MQTAQARNVIRQSATAMIEQIKPAAAMPLAPCFLAIADKIIPAIPKMIPTHWKKGININTNAKMPNTNPTIAKP